MKTKYDLAHKQLNPVLRPCPFCGGEASIEHYSNPFQCYEHGSYVVCHQCGAQTRKFTYVPYRLYIKEGSMNDTSGILAANRWNSTPEEDGTYACPDCGVSIPHNHREKDSFGTIIVDIK